jgi:hypothetical protein
MVSDPKCTPADKAPLDQGIIGAQFRTSMQYQQPYEEDGAQKLGTGHRPLNNLPLEPIGVISSIQDV